jgi:hypothetical protein
MDPEVNRIDSLEMQHKRVAKVALVNFQPEGFLMADALT